MLSAAVPRPLLCAVVVLAVLGSLSEGLGLILLVPILGLIGTGPAARETGLPGRLWHAGAELGMPTGLGGMLVLFVA